MSSALESDIEAFIVYLRDVRRLSSHTIAAYQRDLGKLADHLSNLNRSAARDVREADIRGWVATLHREGLAAPSIQRALSAARAWYRYLTARDPALGNPVEHVRAPKRGRRLPKSLEPDAVGTLLDRQEDDPLLLRDLAMAELIYSSGLRLQELTSLDFNALDRSDRTLTVTGKGAKTRTVPVGDAALKALDRWLAVRGGQCGPNEPLFISQRGQRISPRSVQARLAQLARSGQLSQPLHPHMLRHAFASHLLESSGDLRAVQELLGHANIGTTQIYTHLDFQHLAKTYDAAHPRAQRRKKT